MNILNFAIILLSTIHSIGQTKTDSLTVTSMRLTDSEKSNFHTQNDLENLVFYERAFADLSAKTSTKNAFLHFLAEDGILFKPNAVNGIAFWKSQQEDSEKLTWNPRFADVSISGDLGYTLGLFEYRKNREDEIATGVGHYVSLWSKQKNGEWKLILDTGISHAPTNYPSSAINLNKIKRKKNPATSIEEFLKTEQAFCLAQNRDGLKAYKNWMANGIKIFRPMTLPIESNEAIENFIKATDKKFSFSPTNSFIAKSNDLGYVYGTGTVTINQAEKSRIINTNYLRIWKKEDGKNWKIVLDLVSISK